MIYIVPLCNYDAVTSHVRPDVAPTDFALGADLLALDVADRWTHADAVGVLRGLLTDAQQPR